MSLYDEARAQLEEGCLITAGEIAERYPRLYSAGSAVGLRLQVPEAATLDPKTIVVAGPPRELTFSQVLALNPTLIRIIDRGLDIKKYGFSGDLVLPRWLALQKEPHHNSFDRTWDEQRALVKAPYRVLNVAEIAWVLTVASKVRNWQLFPDIFVRTSSTAAFSQVYIGHAMDAKIIDVHFYGGNDRFPGIGVAAGRTF